ncbi:MAG: MFS transporter [Firmicutes bacterium HGW-Firmicutes-4]|jgi:predicted MFS family arabinose efflux permease|nr:MAG: MFS transporter [Firmicutes bacterium HGW-Firmicutes-4]
MEVAKNISAENVKKQSPGAILFIMLLSMTAGALCLNKVSPVVTQIIESLGLTGDAQAGMLISVFVFSGIILAIPVGMIITRYGMFKTGLVAIIAILIGSVIGALAVSYEVLLVSRIIEGIGLIFLATIGPAAVGESFSEKHRATAMGLLMCFMAFGQIIVLNLGPRIAVSSSWRNVWWFTAVYAVINLILWIVIARKIDVKKAENIEEQNSLAKETLVEVIRNKNIWLVGITFALYLIGQQGTFAFLTRYLSVERGLDVTAAASLLSVASLIGIPVGILTGVVADKVGSRKYPLGILMVSSAICYAFMPNCPTSLYFIMIVIYGICTMGIAGLCFSSVADVIEKPEQASMAVSIVNLMQWIGIFISSLLFGFIVESFSWEFAFYAMVPIALLGAVTTFVNKKMK